MSLSGFISLTECASSAYKLSLNLFSFLKLYIYYLKISLYFDIFHYFILFPRPFL